MQQKLCITCQHVLGEVQLHLHLSPGITNYRSTLLYWPVDQPTFLDTPQQGDQRPQRSLGWHIQQDCAALLSRACQASGMSNLWKTREMPFPPHLFTTLKIWSGITTIKQDSKDCLRDTSKCLDVI